MSREILAKNLMILASAGSGKTFQLGNRVIGLVGAQGVDPARIVALTFTRKAAGEFADSVLSKLAKCAADPLEASALWQQVGSEFDAVEVLGRVVKALPVFQLGTMDSFFARVVRGFQYELGLTGGTFELIEGPKLEAAMSDILADILGDAIEHENAAEFLHAFRRATLGKQGQGVLRDIERFLGSWHGLWKSGIPLPGWGGQELFGKLPDVNAWESDRHPMIADLRRGESRQPLLDLLERFELHTVGSGKVAKTGGVLFERILEQVRDGGDIDVAFNRSRLLISGPAADRWRELYQLLAACELAAAASRTRAVADLVASLDAECERRLRRKGLLGFDDVKLLMGRWTGDEEARLRREAVDFRLDARHDHWLLDEFQDTSRAEWDGLVPLLDEAASGDEGTLFVVGDRKQAIYGWRGGDVTLFDEVGRRYGSNAGLKVETMPESWRSCPPVLDLVNSVCGDFPTICHLFGSAAERWHWENHVSARPAVSGESRVEVVAKDDIGDYLVGLLRSIGVGERDLTCGVLVRTNEQVRSFAALLREEGFDVIEEGRRQPVADNAPGVALLHLIRWLADPADPFAREVLAMSPLWPLIRGRFGEAWQAAWEGLLVQAQERGFAAMVETLIEPLWTDMSEFSRRRAGDVIGALAEYDAGGAGTAREAARWIADLEIPQSPGAAAVQVLTIHKSKGLGFDVVVLPSVEDERVPNRGDFAVARGIHQGRPWLLEPPPSWVRDIVPVLTDAESAWAEDQCYEAMCVLYVALTRAKRGLYVTVPEVPRSRKDPADLPSPANWIRSSTGGGDTGVLFQSGDELWWQSVPARERPVKQPVPTLPGAVPRRARVSPSGAKSGGSNALSSGGTKLGSEAHRFLERLGWIDEEELAFMPGDAGKLVWELLQKKPVRALFERRGRPISLYREQPVEAIVDGKWLSGVVDRLHVFTDPLGLPERIELIDFKTDSVSSSAKLLERYQGQMNLYREVLGRAFGVPVACYLASTRLGSVIEVKE